MKTRHIRNQQPDMVLVKLVMMENIQAFSLCLMVFMGVNMCQWWDRPMSISPCVPNSTDGTLELEVGFITGPTKESEREPKIHWFLQFVQPLQPLKTTTDASGKKPSWPETRSSLASALSGLSELQNCRNGDQIVEYSTLKHGFCLKSMATSKIL